MVASYFHTFANATTPLRLVNFSSDFRTLPGRGGKEGEVRDRAWGQGLLVFILCNSGQPEIF